MKRRLFKLALFIIFGSIINVLVGWLCLLKLAEKPTSVLGSMKHHRDSGDFIVSSDTFGTHRKYFSARSGVDFTLDSPEESFREELFIDEIIFDLGTELYDAYPFLEQSDRLLFVDQSELNEWDSAIHTRAGWPSLSLLGIQRFKWSGGGKSITTRHIIGALVIPGRMLGREYGFAVPLRSIWPDFALNTAIYAALLWLLTFVPFTVQRMIRNKRGRCIKCGYDLRGDSVGCCPECGYGRDKPIISLGKSIEKA